MRLSKNFSLKELIKSETATRKNINNNPNEDNIENLQRNTNTDRSIQTTQTHVVDRYNRDRHRLRRI